MTLTEKEKQYILELLNSKKRSKLETILSSVESFLNWLAKKAYDIYRKIEEYIKTGIAYRIWEYIRDKLGI
jgi:hypothetical protein